MMKRILWALLIVVLVAIGAGMVTLFLDYSSTDKDLRAAYERSARDRRELRAELARQEQTSRALADQVKALGEEPVVDPPTALTTTIQGLTGPRGIPGVTGPRGLQGPGGATGATGATGGTGTAGEAGESGPAGAQGAQGPKGETGPAGAQGPAGEKGDPGPLCPSGTTATQIWVQTRTDPYLPATQQWRQTWICTAAN